MLGSLNVFFQRYTSLLYTMYVRYVSMDEIYGLQQGTGNGDDNSGAQPYMITIRRMLHGNGV